MTDHAAPPPPRIDPEGLASAIAKYRETKVAFGGDWADGVLGIQRTYAEEALGRAVAALIDAADEGSAT